MSYIPCIDPEFREQVRDVHIFIYRAVIKKLLQDDKRSSNDERMIALTLSVMSECEKCIKQMPKEKEDAETNTTNDVLGAPV